MAATNAASLAFEGWWNPVIFRTNCKEAARTSSGVTGGSKLNSVLMLRHMVPSSVVSVRLLSLVGVLPLPLRCPFFLAAQVYRGTGTNEQQQRFEICLYVRNLFFVAGSRNRIAIDF